MGKSEKPEEASQPGLDSEERIRRHLSELVLDAQFAAQRCICPLALCANRTLRYPRRRAEKRNTRALETTCASHNA
jgi:hypothetical protein